MKKIVLLIACALAITACNNKAHLSGINIVSDLSIAVKDSEGNDLLNPETPGHFSVYETKLSYVDKHGEIKNIRLPSSGYHVGIMGLTDYYGFGDLHFLWMVNDDNLIYNTNSIDTWTSAVSTTFITWPDGAVDKIEGKYYCQDASIHLTDVTINEEFHWYCMIDGKMTRPFFLITIGDGTRNITVLPSTPDRQ